MRFIIVRHGETAQNQDGAITGQMDVGLTEEGRRQAERVAERLAGWSFDGIYTSDLERTAETIKVIADRHDTTHEPREAFRERSYGVYEGEPKETWRSVLDAHDGDTFTLRPDDGESMQEAADRYIEGMERIWRENGREGTVLIGGHAVALRATLMDVLGARTPQAYDAISLDNAGITELRYEDRDWSIQRMNDTAHLE
jgi:broad specificity phosphatase PhoE